MPLLHDPSVRERIESRVRSLTPGSTRRWGKMSIDQMLWHVNASLEVALGRLTSKPDKAPLPKPLIKFLALHVPWPRGAPTNPDTLPPDSCNFEKERARTLALIDELVARDLDASWPEQPRFGRMRGKDWSLLQAKHLDHHLRQFGA